MKNELGALMLWIDRKLNKNHDALVTKIDAIQNLFETSSEASASAADILEGKTAFNGTTLMTGTMVNQESREATLLAGGTYNIPRGFHDGAGRVLATDLASQTAGTATAGGILQGLKAWVAGRMIDGTMKDRRGVTVAAGAVTQDDEYTYLSIPEEACYNANSKVRTPNSNLSKKKVATATKHENNNMSTTGCAVTITVPVDCVKGTLIADLYGYNDSRGCSIQITNSAGIKTANQLLDCFTGNSYAQSAFTSIWACEFIPGRTITLLFKNPNYGASNNKIMIAY